MRKVTVWLLAGVLLASMVYAMADKGTVPTQANQTVSALCFGDEGDAVARVQKKLAELNYYSGEINGQFKEDTQAAVSQFQKDYALDKTGIADVATQNALNAAKYRPLAKGMSGEDVKSLQTRLTELDYYDGKISGDFKDGTFSAVSNFQKKNGLASSGLADVNTLTLLFDPARALGKNDTATPAPTPTPVPPSPSPVVTIAPTAASGAAVNESEPAQSPVPYEKQLKRGSKGDLVTLLQNKLFELGYYIDESTGNYDTGTRDAVKEFQQNNGITADGVTGEKTWNMIFNNAETLDVNATPRPTPVPTPVPYALTVDINNQVITAYGLDENNQYTKVVRQMICSTGTRATPTDIGSWKLNKGRAKFPLFSKYNVYVQYFTPIANGFGFHSVIYNTQNTRDLITSTYYGLGARASHGCIRLQVADAKWIYDNAGKGTVVTITNKLPYDPELTMSLKPAPLDRKSMLPKATPAPTPSPVYSGTLPPPMPLRTLEKGDKGDDVYWLQMKLKELGYYTGTVTGGYYGGTQKAVKAYQKDHGISADGVAGVKTQNTLYADVLPDAEAESTSNPES